MYAEKYDKQYKGSYGEEVEKEMKALFKKQRYLIRGHLIKIGRWKSKRPTEHYKSQENDDLTVKEITWFSFNTKSEKARIKSLLVLKGVSWAVASVILHFGFPRKYPIMDFRVIRSLGWKRRSTYNFQFWQRYCQRIRSISKQLGLPIRTIEKALWKYDKEKHSRSKKLTCTSRRSIKYHSSH